ncbi:MAG: prolyl oligopeptidase family serine peptidase [Caulobacteraceae bacterium]
MKHLWATAGALLASSFLASPPAIAAPSDGGPFTIAEALDYPFVDHLVSAKRADEIAWVRTLQGARNILVASAPGFVPRQVTQFTADDGQELSDLTFSPDGSTLVFVRGGDHDANWPAKGSLAPDPTSSPVQPKETIWAVDLSVAKPAHAVTEGDDPALSARGELAYVKDRQVWTARLDGTGAHRLFFDHGETYDHGVGHDLSFSPDGSRLAFVSDRDEHALIGIFTDEAHPILWLSPSTGRDSNPVWSPDGGRIAFTRRAGKGGPAEPILERVPHPWAIWSADASNGAGHLVWASPDTLHGSFPDETAGAANLHWAAGDRLVFTADVDGWPHLWVASEAGGEPARLLTPGAYMVEDVAEAPDARAFVFSANTGARTHDFDRRHLFEVSADGGPVKPLTSGQGLEWTPQALSGTIAFIGAGVAAPTVVEAMAPAGEGRRALAGQAPPADFPGADFVAPRSVSWPAPDGLAIHGQLFEGAGPGPHPGVIFVHGGPPRQMLLGWHYMDYYSNSYAVNQWLAAHGFTVLSVDYRLGIGWGWDFNHPAHAGPTGASEYQDVLSGARFLQRMPGVDPARIGMWGGSYGGFLTELALARNSDVFKAGVEMHGIADWTPFLDQRISELQRYSPAERARARAVFWAASPDADMDKWTSPLLLIQGDDDRNVHFSQMVDLDNRLDRKGVSHEDIVFPDEIHGFLRNATWLKADAATVDFFEKTLGQSR